MKMGDNRRGAMRILSVNVGLPRPVTWGGRAIITGIFKEPVAGRIAVRALNLDGDRQADLTVHGGREKAVYAYPAEHYAYWRAALPGVVLEYGAFGENLTTEGLLEDDGGRCSPRSGPYLQDSSPISTNVTSLDYAPTKPPGADPNRRSEDPG